MNIKKFTIFGERNSGTNYLKNVLIAKLNLDFTEEYGFKHWYIKNHYPRGKENSTTDNECLKDINDSDDTLFIYIIRNPYDWVCSMYKKPYHIKNIDKSSLYNFISNKYIAYENSCPRDCKNLWFKDENEKFFIEEANNIIELRNLKNKHFYNLKNKVKNFCIIRQENLFNDINIIINHYKLPIKNNKIPKYNNPHKYDIDQKSIDFIKENIDNEIDNKYYMNI
jgi:hypothetical protein